MLETLFDQAPGATLPIGVNDLLLVFQGGKIKRVNAGQVTGSAPATALPAHAASHNSGGSDPITVATPSMTTVGPTLLAIAAEVTMTHPAVTNERVMFSASKAGDATGLTRLQADFDVADAGDFTYDSDKLEFAGGVVKLKATAVPAANQIVAHAPGSLTSASGTLDVSNFSLSGGYDGSEMVDGNNATFSRSGSSTPNAVYTFNASKTIGSYSLTCGDTPANMGSAWVLETYNGVSWDVVDTRSSQTGWSAQETRTFTLSLPATNTMFRIRYTAINGGGYADLAEWRLLSVGSSSYTTAEYATVETKNASQFPFSGSSDTVTVNTVTFDKTTPANTNIKVLVSFDGRVTWKKRSGGAWVTVSGADLLDPSTWNTVAEMEAGFPYTVQPSDVGLDWRVALETDDAAATPEVSGISINYDEALVFDMASVGPTGASVDVIVTRLTPTTTKFKNNTGAEGTFLLNALVGE